MRLERLFLFLLISCNYSTKGKIEVKETRFDTSILGHSKTKDLTYTAQLEEIKKNYPFNNWRMRYKDGLTQYTESNCDKAQALFDTLIGELISLGQEGKETVKLDLFKTAILALNKLNDQVEGLIETEEREELCELIDKITIAAGMYPKNYAGGDGIADQWREW